MYNRNENRKFLTLLDLYQLEPLYYHDNKNDELWNIIKGIE